MKLNRLHLLGGVLVLVMGYLVWDWVSGWGLITLDVYQAPLSTVLAKVQRQGGVKVYTNADPASPITMKVHRMPLQEALDNISAQVEGNLQLAYVAAPSAGQITEILNAFVANTDLKGWSVFQSPRMGMINIADTYDAPPMDSRKMPWTVGGLADNNIQTLFQQGSQKTGVLFAAPKDWNPTLAKLPANGTVQTVTYDAVKKAKGTLSEVYLITARRDDNRDQNARNDGKNRGEGGGGGWMGGGGGGGVFAVRFERQNMNQDWMAEQMQAQIASLPAEARADAQKQYDQMREMFKSIKDLPDDQRRAKFEELMNDPSVQDKMQNAAENRDAKSGPQRRENRMKRYNERKQQMKSKSS